MRGTGVQPGEKNIGKASASYCLTLPMRDVSEHSWTVPANTS